MPNRKKREIKRVAIMTGGGDCPGLNPVIRAAVKTGVTEYGWEILGVEDAFSGLIDLEYRRPRGNRWLDLEVVHGIIRRGGTILGTSNRSDPFHYVIEDPDGTKRTVDVFDKILENIEILEIDALISVGGDGSMRISKMAMDRGLTNIVGVPKTIDNDLKATDYTFGFNSAVQVATDLIDRLHDTAESHDRVIIVEVMGRDAGHIALNAGIAGGAHAILIPEIPYHAAPLEKMIKRRRAAGHPYDIIVCAESARPAGGQASALPAELGAMKRYVGAAAQAAALLNPRIGLEVRQTVLGHVQRGGSPSAFDRILGTRMGSAAAHMVAQRKWGRMVALRGDEITDVSIDEAIDSQKLVDPHGELVRAARDVGIVFGDEDL